MKLLIKFDIYACEPPAGLHGTAVFVTSPAIYLKIWNVSPHAWKENTWPPGDSRSHVYVAADPGDPALVKIFELLRTAGWKPYFGSELPEELRNDHFLVFYSRRYSDQDFARADYLWLNAWGDNDTIAAVAGRRDEQWIGSAQDACWEVRFARMGGGNNAFVNDELRVSLQAAKLKALNFQPLEWDEPRLAKGKFWEMDSKVTMPPCLLPTVQSVTSNMIDGSQQFGTFYDDGCYRPLELVFRRSEVETMGRFDIAHTREDLLWTRPDVGRHMLVVTQKFRQTLKELGVEDVTYGIVRLVSDDWQRPLSDHDRLRMDEV